MKRLVILMIVLVNTSILAQTPIIEFKDSTYDEGYSTYLYANDNVVLNFSSSVYDGLSNQRITFDNQLIIDSLGIVKKHLIIDSMDYPGYSIYIPVLIEKDNFIYQFGNLVSYDAKQFRVLIRKSDSQLNLLFDTIVNLNNRFFFFTEGVIDSSDMVLTGISSTSGFVFRFDKDINLIDSLSFIFAGAQTYNASILAILDSTIQVKFTSEIAIEDNVFEFRKSSFKLEDTLYTDSIVSGGTYYSNPYEVFINDSTYVTTISAFRTHYPLDTFTNAIGYYKWNMQGKILDTILPFYDSLLCDYTGFNKVILTTNQDSLIIGFIHNKCYGIPTNLSNIGLLFCDFDGNTGRVVYFGSLNNYRLENLCRFENGNILVVASKVKWSFPETNDLVIWLLDSQGNLLEEIEIPPFVQEGFKVFPNPSKDYIQIGLQENIRAQSIFIFDSSGKCILKSKPNANSAKIDISHLPSGIYLINGITEDKQTFTRKFVKQ